MAFDHANYFVAQKHSPGEYWGGPFPSYDRAAPFLARLVTHPAAPGFFFLMGLGLSLFAASRFARGWTKRDVARHFVLRGALLIALQLTVVAFAWRLTPWGWPIRLYGGVLFGLGAAMLLCVPLVSLRPRWLLPASVLLAVACFYLTPSPEQWGRSYPALARLLLIPGGSEALWVNYPVLPWLAIALFGVAFGQWLRDDAGTAYRRALWIGGGMVGAFLITRLLPGFGDARASSGIAWIDLLNVVKYPPSIDFVTLTLGANLVVFGLLGHARARWQAYLRPLAALGTEPLLFYVLHLFVYATLGRLFAPQGTSLLAMVPVWLLGLGILYPACSLYRKAKRNISPKSVLRIA